MATQDLHAGALEVRRLDLLLRVCRAGRPRTKAELANEMAGDWEEVSRTVFRDVDWLAANGFLEETACGFRYPLGHWPSIRLTVAEWQQVDRMLGAIARQHPENGRIQKSWAALRSALRWHEVPAPLDESGPYPTLVLRGWDGPGSATQASKRRQLEAIMQEGRAVRFRYRPATPPEDDRTIPPDGCIVEAAPVGFVYWGELDSWYLGASVLDSSDQASDAAVDRSAPLHLFRLDRLDDPQPIPCPAPLPRVDLTEALRLAWGVELGTPTPVTVRFSDAAYVREKVERIVRLRPSARCVQEAGGCLRYTDVVAGLGEFSRWVRQFGMAAEVVEPPELRAMLRRTAEEWLILYQREPEPVEPLLAGAEEVAASRPAPSDGAVPAILPAQPHGSTGTRSRSQRAIQQFRFLIRLLRYLALHPRSTAAQIAQVLGVTEDGVLRTLTYLIDEQYHRIPLYMEPSEADGDDRRHARWSLMETYQVPPVELDLADLVAFFRALQLFEKDAHVRTTAELLRESLEPWLETAVPQTLYRFLRGRSALFLHEDEADLVSRLHDAARAHREVRLWYQGSSESVPRQWTVRPLAVVYAWDPGAWYLVAWPVSGAREGETVLWQGVPLIHLRVDRIRSTHETAARFTLPPEWDLTAYLEPIWGMEAGTEPVRVVVRFRDEANVIMKARRQTAHRQRARWYRVAPDAYLYVDWVVGENEFLRWVRGFGRSAELLAPRPWRSRMLQTAMGVLEKLGGAGVAPESG